MLPDWLERLLARRPAGRWALLLLYGLDKAQAPLAASAMAFDAFLSLVPLLAFAGYLIERLHQSGDLALGPIERAAPAPVGDFVHNELTRLSEGGTFAIAPVSLVAFIWVSSAGLATAMSVFESMFRCPARPWWLRRLLAIGCVLVGLVLAVVATLLGLGLGELPPSPAASVLKLAVPPVALAGLLVGFFRLAIGGPRQRRSLWPGAAVTVVLWSLVSVLFSVYVARFSRYATLYGSLATAAIFLFWLWLLALSLLVGSEVNAMREGLRDEGARPAP